MNTIHGLFGATPRLVPTRACCAAIVAIAASTACAEPLNALDFTSLGNKTFVAGTHTIFTDTATLNGPTAGSGGGSGAGGRVFIQPTSAPTLTGVNVAGGAAGTGGTGSPNGTNVQAGGNGATTNVAATLTTTLDFGNVTIGTSKTLGMVIGCTGAANTAVNERFPSATAPLARVGNGIFSNLAAGRKSANEYTFTPTHAGPHQQTLTSLSDGGNATVIIMGYGDCRSDLNQDLMADDADFVTFAADYEALLCP